MPCARTTWVSLWPIALALVMGAGIIQSQEEKPTGKMEYPLWNGKESVADYAKSLKLEPEVTLDLGDGVKIELVLIPAGNFVMGSPKDEKDRDDNEGPQHEVTLGKPFYMGKFEVTQEQYKKLIKENPSHFKGARNPVENVSWNDAQEFCKKLGQKTGRTVRLPTEAEWEHACRAGSKSRFHPPRDPEKIKPLTDELRRRVADLIPRLTSDEFDVRDKATKDLIVIGKGTLPLLDQVKTENAEVRIRLTRVKTFLLEPDLDKLAWYDENSDGKSHPVGEKEPNAFGLYDMHGNVWEWVEDDWHDDYINAPTNGQAWKDKPNLNYDRVLRGGSWTAYDQHCRSSKRGNGVPDLRFPYIGFRVVYCK
jgi:formylglycine-generating enzyme required for sulfatase activity